jgi:hypothetical protein
MTNKKKSPIYPGPAWAVVSQYDQVKVLQDLKKLGVESHHRMEAFDDEPLLISGDEAKDWTPTDPVILQAQSDATTLSCWRSQLLSAHIHRWATGLSESDCWKVIEAHKGERVSISERRYVNKDRLIQMVGWSVYAQEHTKGKEEEQ